MSVRGPRGGRGRGRDAGRGRGRGRGKTQLWEWESYTPGPEVYNQLWRIRKQPAVVTPRLPRDCPLANARTRILDRRLTEGPIYRNVYMIEVAYGPDSVGRDGGKELVEVDVSRILDYVSSAELERFENAQFSLEAEVEAIALRADADELARLRKNARVPAAGALASRGSRILNGRDLGIEPPTRSRGRGRARGRARERAAWRGIGGVVLTSRLRHEDMREELVDVEPEELQLVIAETESEGDESEADAPAQTSPSLMRSAFFANSALPASSPVALKDVLGGRLEDLIDYDDWDEQGRHGKWRQTQNTASHQRISEEDFQQTPLFPDRSSALDDDDDRRIPEEAFQQTPLFPDRSSALDEDEDDDPDDHQHIPKEAFQQTPLFPDRSSVLESDSDESIPAHAPYSRHSPQTHRHDMMDIDDTVRGQPQPKTTSPTIETTKSKPKSMTMMMKQ
ncbi:hypothetical protein EJ02DRAFT_453296 [Clathrospora elynae]|uniref:Uncharacterized protein n=1 Tax=Clathrospora elynae TaxID=706981 RepID=A0A6A5SU45_9PLEO|nr:hypothetical protein EJ02DRAFT_453296 [Clathrospora elynae]